MSVTVVSVAVEQTAYHFDKPYDYFLPPEFDADNNMEGRRVLVPFGTGNMTRCGFVLSVKKAETVEKLKAVAEILDESPVLGTEMLELGAWIKEQTFCTLYEAYKAMLPSGLNMKLDVRYKIAPNIEEKKFSELSDKQKNILLTLGQAPDGLRREQLLSGLECDAGTLGRLVKKGFVIRSEVSGQRVGDATVRTARLYERQDMEEPLKLTAKQKTIVSLLSEMGPATVKEICYFTGIGESVIKNLEKKGIIELYETEVYRTPREAEVEPCDGVQLNRDQKAAFSKLLKAMEQPKGSAALLFGVTGSGKTQVYLKLIEENLSAGKDSVVMVPEISLTPQVISIFRRRFGNNVAVFHSRLSLGERLDEWKRVKRGEAKIAIGTRSAVFAPFENLGLIVIDEEQEHTYKSEASPRYHARDVARFRAAYHGALLLLASATPSVESFARASEGKYILCRLNSRFGKAVLPRVETIDMRDEIMNGNVSVISEKLLELLTENLQKGKQSILLLNRRGYNTYISCRSCGKVLTCENCSISMSYHRANGRLMCHYCGASKELPECCPECGGEFIKMSGIGTQYAENEIEKLLPGARVLRMDADTTMTKNAHAEKLSAFAEGEYDILIGTQMVAKGLDFANVNLVGVLNADQALYNSDFRAYERAFALLTQVIGRAGRGSDEGVAALQTVTPDNELIRMAANQNYDEFFREEIALRRVLEYPPYCDICMIGFTGREDLAVCKASKYMFELMKKLVCGEYADVKVKILGPSPAKILKIGGKYRYRLIIKCRNSKRFRSMLKEALIQFGQSGIRGISVYADMNPEGII